MILIDVDSTVADLMPEWLGRYNAEYNDNVTPEQITDWDIDKFVKCGAKIYKYLQAQDLYDSVKPIEGSYDGVKYIRKAGWRVVFVSAGLHLAAQKYAWLARHGFGVTEKDFIVAFDKSLVRGDILIDDKPENVKSFPGVGILFSQPWNTSLLVNRRLDTWKNIADWL